MKRGYEKWNLIVFSEIWQSLFIFAKVFGIIARKCKAPQVVGEIIAGLLIGPSVLGLVQQSDFSDPDGRNRCYPADVLRRTGDESEGSDEDGICGISDRMLWCICSFGRRNIVVYGILRSGTLGL